MSNIFFSISENIALKEKVRTLGKIKRFWPHYELAQSIQYFEKNGIVEFKDIITKQEWQKFLQGTQRTGIVIVESIAPGWSIPSRISIVRYDHTIIDFSGFVVEYSKNNIQYNRNVNDFDSKGFCMVGEDPDRCNFVQTLYAFGLDRDLEMYHPACKRTTLTNDLLSINRSLQPCQEKKLHPHYRWNFAKNLDVVKNRLIKNDLEINVGNIFLQEPGGISEKNFYGAIFGIPSFQIMSPDMQNLMRDLGFRFIYPEGKDLIKSSIEWISMFCRLSSEQRQIFQNDLGEDMAHNHKAICNLGYILREKTEEDLRKL